MNDIQFELCEKCDDDDLDNLEDLDDEIKKHPNTYGINLKLTPEVKEYFKNYIQTNSTAIHADFIAVPPLYKEYHKQIRSELRKLLKDIIKVPKGEHKPTDFAITLILCMDPMSIDSIDENFIGFFRDDYFMDLGGFTDDADDDITYICGCGKNPIYDIFEIQHRVTGIRIYVGCECIRKYKLLPTDVIKEGIRKIRLKKKYKQCPICKDYCIPKEEEQTKFCDECVVFMHNCSDCNNEYKDRYKTPSETICDSCIEIRNKTIIKRQKVKIEILDSEKLSLSNLNMGDLFSFDTFILININNNKYLIQKYNTIDYYWANKQVTDVILKIDINKKEYKKKTITTILNFIVIEKYVNNYGHFTVKLNIYK